MLSSERKECTNRGPTPFQKRDTESGRDVLLSHSTFDKYENKIDNFMKVGEPKVNALMSNQKTNYNRTNLIEEEVLETEHFGDINQQIDEFINTQKVMSSCEYYRSKSQNNPGNEMHPKSQVSSPIEASCSTIRQNQIPTSRQADGHGRSVQVVDNKTSPNKLAFSINNIGHQNSDFECGSRNNIPNLVSKKRNSKKAVTKTYCKGTSIDNNLENKE